MHVENFLSFGKADFDLDRVGLTLVEGDNMDDESARSNGSGKSSMVDALVWCLFGVTLRGYDKDEVVNRKADGGCVVSVWFERDDDTGWCITRRRRHPKMKNALTITDSVGADVSKTGAKETQEEIGRLLGCTEKAFLSSVVFGQDRAYRFGSLTDAEQKAILDEVIGVERFAQACAAARKRASALQAQADACRRDLARAESDLSDAEGEAVDLQAKHVDFADTQRRKIEAERQKLGPAQGYLAAPREDVAELRKVVDSILAKLSRLEKKADGSSELEAALRARLAAAASKLGDAKAELRQHLKLSGTCSVCGQEVNAKARTRVVASVREKIAGLEAEHKDASRSVDEAAKAAGGDKRALRDARDAMVISQKLLNEAVGADANAKAWRQRVSEHEARIAELEAEVSPYAALAAKALARHARLEVQVKQLALDLSQRERELEVAEFWVEAFGARGLRSLMVDSSLPLLNQEAARVSRAVTGGSISIEFSTTSEQKSGKVVDRFEVRVDNRHGAGDYRGNSAGERAKVDLCVGIALQRLVASRSSASFNLAFFDEAFDHLDSAAHERVVEVLSELDKDSVFVISHNEDLRAFFPNVLTIRKAGGFSSVAD